MTTAVPTIDGITLTPSKIKEESMGHTMNLLSELYVDAHYAVVRELMANGRDSHALAGKPDAPVRITLAASPDYKLIVQDEGVGMSREMLEEVFVNFGDGIKQDDPNAVGWFRIGSKSPLQVTDRYTINSVHDGFRTTVLMALDQDNVPGYAVLDYRQTNEPNGVTVIVPVREEDLKSWEQAINHNLYWQDPSTFMAEMPLSAVDYRAMDAEERLEVDPNTPILADRNASCDITAELSTDTVTIIGGRSNPKSPLGDARGALVRMGGIIYRIPSKMRKFPRPEYATIVFEAPVKSLEIPPNRESIKDTAANNAYLQEMYRQWSAAMHERYIANILTKKTSLEVYEAVTEATQIADGIPGLDSKAIFEKLDLKRSIELEHHYYEPGVKAVINNTRIERVAYENPDYDPATDYPYQATNWKDEERSRFDVQDAQAAAGKDHLVLPRSQYTKGVQALIKNWRLLNATKTLHVFDETKLGTLADPSAFTWISADEMRKQTPKYQDIVLKDDDYVLDFNKRATTYQRSVGVPITVAELKAQVDKTDRKEVIIATPNQACQRSYSHLWQYYPGMVLINNLGATPQRWKELLGGITVRRISDVLEEVTNDLNWEQRRDDRLAMALAEPAFVRKVADEAALWGGFNLKAIGKRVDAGEFSKKTEKALLSMIALNEHLYSYEDEHWGLARQFRLSSELPAPAKKYTFPLLMEVLGALGEKASAALIENAAAADLAAQRSLPDDPRWWADRFTELATAGLEPQALVYANNILLRLDVLKGTEGRPTIEQEGTNTVVFTWPNEGQNLEVAIDDEGVFILRRVNLFMDLVDEDHTNDEADVIRFIIEGF